MTYRDDLDAARNRRESLARQLADVRARLGDREALLAEERRLAAALEDTRAHIEHARKRVDLPLLRDVQIASPCNERWDVMQGDERARFCGRCEQTVFDLSEMTAVEAEAVLAAHGGAACVRFYRRADGTVMTSDCPDNQRRRARRRVLALGSGLAASGAAAVAIVAQSPDAVPTCKATDTSTTCRAADSYRALTHEADYYVMGGTGAPPRPIAAPPVDAMPTDAMLPDHPSLTDPDWQPAPPPSRSAR